MQTLPTRRSILKSAAGLAGGWALTGRDLDSMPVPSGPLLPTVKLGSHEITRLIVGSNPFNGYCYALPSLSEHMREWSTPENVCGVFRRSQENGINTWQFSYHDRAMADLRKYQAEGGTIQWILLGGGPMKTDLELIPQAAKLKPVGIVHHGGVTDERFRSGQMAKVEEFLKRVRDSGVLVGLSTHLPQVVEFAEERDWDIDFYMTCFYQFSRTEEELRKMLGELPLGYVFLEKDPERMCRVIRQTNKTCLAFKVLAAGRLADTKEKLERAFRYAFSNIKPQDAVIVGMYPRFKDEIRENAETVRRILSRVS
ncbi:MAG: hypothetical protein HXY20_07920 [Acidobacteria bacterium]|nr:hypothetical protein [Acidobacteriota bacterium]